MMQIIGLLTGVCYGLAALGFVKALYGTIAGFTAVFLISYISGKYLGLSFLVGIISISIITQNYIPPESLLLLVLLVFVFEKTPANNRKKVYLLLPFIEGLLCSMKLSGLALSSVIYVSEPYLSSPTLCLMVEVLFFIVVDLIHETYGEKKLIMFFFILLSSFIWLSFFPFKSEKKVQEILVAKNNYTESSGLKGIYLETGIKSYLDEEGRISDTNLVLFPSGFNKGPANCFYEKDADVLALLGSDRTEEYSTEFYQAMYESDAQRTLGITYPYITLMFKGKYSLPDSFPEPPTGWDPHKTEDVLYIVNGYDIRTIFPKEGIYNVKQNGGWISFCFGENPEWGKSKGIGSQTYTRRNSFTFIDDEGDEYHMAGALIEKIQLNIAEQPYTKNEGKDSVFYVLVGIIGMISYIISISNKQKVLGNYKPLNRIVSIDVFLYILCFILACFAPYIELPDISKSVDGEGLSGIWKGNTGQIKVTWYLNEDGTMKIIEENPSDDYFVEIKGEWETDDNYISFVTMTDYGPTTASILQRTRTTQAGQIMYLYQPENNHVQKMVNANRKGIETSEWNNTLYISARRDSESGKIGIAVIDLREFLPGNIGSVWVSYIYDGNLEWQLPVDRITINKDGSLNGFLEGKDSEYLFDVFNDTVFLSGEACDICAFNYDMEFPDYVIELVERHVGQYVPGAQKKEPTGLPYVF